jgi:hypothetical protein
MACGKRRHASARNPEKPPTGATSRQITHSCASTLGKPIKAAGVQRRKTRFWERSYDGRRAALDLV